ncbi:hypothetical protein V8E54_008662 [Elaphomyces granulatus]
MSVFQLSLLFLSAASLCWSQFLFHGSAVVIFPSYESSQPKNSTFVAANFFSYAGPTGYFSFGWWLPAVPGTNSDHCTPNSDIDEVGWYEYTTSGGCNDTTCHVHVLNYLVSNQTTPDIDEDYIAMALDIANGATHGQLALSYFDTEGGGFGVASRKVLSGEDADKAATRDCHDAFMTLVKLKAKWDVPLAFELKNPCKIVPQSEGQIPLGNGPWA